MKWISIMYHVDIGFDLDVTDSSVGFAAILQLVGWLFCSFTMWEIPLLSEIPNISNSSQTTLQLEAWHDTFFFDLAVNAANYLNNMLSCGCSISALLKDTSYSLDWWCYKK